MPNIFRVGRYLDRLMELEIGESDAEALAENDENWAEALRLYRAERATLEGMRARLHHRPGGNR